MSPTTLVLSVTNAEFGKIVSVTGNMTIRASNQPAVMTATSLQLL
jgi:hypothetical protein